MSETPKKRGRPKKVAEKDTTATNLENKLDAFNTLLMDTLNRLTRVEEVTQNISRNFSFHTHTVTLGTGAATFNKVLYDQWLAEQEAAKTAAEKPPTTE